MSVMNLVAGSPAVVIAVLAYAAPALSKRRTALCVAAKTRVPLANSIEVIEFPSSTSWAAFGPPAAAYGLLFVGNVAHVVPQSVVSHRRLVPKAARVGTTPGGETAIGA